MLRFLAFILLISLFFSCVEEVTLDKNEIHPIPCFQSTDVKGCETAVIPMPSDFMAMGVPTETKLNVLPKTPFTVSFSSAVDLTTVSANLMVLKNHNPLVNDTLNISLSEDAKTLIIIPKTGSWDFGSEYIVLLTKGLKDNTGLDFTQPLAFYFASFKESLITNEGKSNYPDLLDDVKANSLERLRLMYETAFTHMETALQKDRSEFLLFYTMTFQPDFLIPCFASTTFEGCENFNEAPIPSDFVMAYNENGSHHLNLPIAEDLDDTTKGMLTMINTLDGWGTSKPFVMNFSKELDATTLDFDLSDGKASVYLLQQTATGAIPVSILSVYDETQRRIVIIPNDGVWLEKTTYLAIFTDSLKGKNGEILVKSTPFSIATSATPLINEEGNSLYSGIPVENATSLELLRGKFAPVFTLLESSPLAIKKENISMMFSVTTQSISNDLLNVWVGLNNETIDMPTDALIPPQLVIPNEGIPEALEMAGVDLDQYAVMLGYAGGEDLYDNVDYAIMGSYKSPNYIDSTLKFFDPSKFPNDPKMESISFYLIIPMPKEENPNCTEMPANGFPIIIFQHGLGGQREHLFAMANYYAENCYASIAIDAVKHGSRQTEGLDSGEGFLSPDVFATRDNIRQTVIDLMQLKRAVVDMSAENFPGMPNGVKLDSTKIGYFGISLGGILGTIFMAYEKDVQVGVLNVPGGGLTNILLLSDTPEIRDPVITALEQMGIVEGTPEFEQFMFLAQLVLDKGDPIGNGYFIKKSPLSYKEGENTINYTAKDILIQEAVGDEVINNQTTDALAHVVGVKESDNNFIKYSGDDVHHSFIMFNTASSQEAKEDMINYFNTNLSGAE